MDKKFDAVKMSRKWREQVSREVEEMAAQEKIAYFKQFSSVDTLLHKSRKERHMVKAA